MSESVASQHFSLARLSATSGVGLGSARRIQSLGLIRRQESTGEYVAVDSLLLRVAFEALHQGQSPALAGQSVATARGAAGSGLWKWVVLDSSGCRLAAAGQLEDHVSADTPNSVVALEVPCE